MNKYIKDKNILIACLSILLAVFACLSFVFYRDGNRIAREAIIENNFIRDKRSMDAVLSEKDIYLKATSFFAEVSATHWNKFSPSYKNKPNVQGLHKAEKAKLFDEIMTLSSLFSFNPMILIVSPTMETSGVPRSDNGIEVGLCHHRHEAIIQAGDFYDRLHPAIQRRCAFRYDSREDMKDPINSIRVEAILIYGYKLHFGGDMAWTITAKHWGLSRADRWQKAGMGMPKKLIFNPKTIHEDLRRPFTYYFAFNEYYSKFNKFDVEVSITKPWIEEYRKHVSKTEWNYIELQRDIAKISRLIDGLNKDKIEFQKEREKRLNELDKAHAKLENKARELKKLVKLGKYTNLKEAVIFLKQYAAEAMEEIINKSVDRSRRIAIMILFVGMLFIMILAMFGFVAACRFLWERREEIFGRLRLGK